MHSKMFRSKHIFIILVLLLSLSCGGGGGGDNTQQTPPTPPPDTNTGTESNPSVVTIGTPVTSSINGVSSNYYSFTTGSSSGSYGIALTGVQADLGWYLYAASDYSSFFVAACDKQFTAVNEICSATLEANKKYYLQVSSWDNKQSTFTVTITFLNPAAGCGSVACVNFEYGSLPSSFISSGNAFWTIDNANAATGTYSIRSGAITDNQTSCFEYAPSGNTEIVLFSLKTDSEQWVDQLKLYIDGVIQSSTWSGNTPWTRVIFGTSPGTHTYKWCYTKDGSISSGADRVWVDDLEFK